MGGLLAHADEETAVLVVSDHGGKRMDGGIRVNEWLRREGLLATLPTATTAVPLARGRDRLVEDDGLGRGRLLLPHLPQRRGPRARGDDRRRTTTSASAATLPSDLPPSPTRTATRSARASSHPEERLPRGERGRAGPDRPLRRSPLALGRHGRRRRGDPHLRERHGPRRCQPRPGRALRARHRPASPPESATAPTSWTSLRRRSSCSGSTSRRRCAARPCCARRPSGVARDGGPGARARRS